MIGYLKNKKGSILLTSYLVITALLVFGGSFLNSALSQIRACETFIDNAKAFHAAELALADAFWRYDNYLPMPACPIFVEGNTFAFIENVNPAFATFTAQSVGFVSDGESIAANATLDQVTPRMRTSKRLQNRGIMNSMLNVMTVGGHGSEFGNLIIQPPAGTAQNSGVITMSGNMVLLGHVNKQDVGVTVTFDPPPVQPTDDTSRALLDRLIDSQFYDANNDALWEPSDLVAYMNLAEAQFSERYPNTETVVKIVIPQSNFYTFTGSPTQVLYTLDIGNLEPEVRTVIIYPDMPDTHTQNFSVNITGNFVPGLDQTFIIAGATKLSLNAVPRSSNQTKSRLSIMSCGDIMLGDGQSDDSDKQDIGLLAISHNNIKIKAKTNSIWNASLFADKDVIITTAPNTHFTLSENRQIYYERAPDLLQMTIPYDLSPYLYVEPTQNNQENIL